MINRPIVYLSFDRFPSAKGAATHINAFATALGEQFGNVSLITIPSEERSRTQSLSPEMPFRIQPRQTTDSALLSQRWEAPGVRHYPLPAMGDNLFERVLSYRAQIRHWWKHQLQTQSDRLPIVHFRSIFEGYPLARNKQNLCNKIVYEVNGLPSIELKYHYPDVAYDQELERKLLFQEQTCLDAADLVLTVSHVNAEHLLRRGVPESRIQIIPNGVDLATFGYQSPSLDACDPSKNPELRCEQHELKMLYAGTMSPWQGVKVAIEALRLYRRDLPACLTVVGHSRPRQKKSLQNFAFDQGVGPHVQFLDAVDKSELAKLHHNADVVLAPLTNNDRNLVQGCSPLKVLEAMASGTPLIASDLPVVRELAQDDVDAILVRPGSAKALKDGLLKLSSERGLALRLSESSRQKVTSEFGWQKAQQTLINAYNTRLL
ncbi:glycosyltransferase family 4 protein [Rubripirellula sp.]|nr:glycosyltransferase family 4 protein [Rubripirellula sp.]MDA7907002.1 glycosyltransferase family 4 protein [bacterium]MDB4621221.1 glycosyltransferase family 4 protein [Rubripirellula sp.]